MFRLLMAGAVVALLTAAAADAATWKVGRDPNGCDGPCSFHDFNTGDEDQFGFGIEGAFTAPTTVPGDTILVYPGDYVRRVIMKSDVVLKSAEGPANTRIVGATGTDPGLFLVDGGFGSVVDGFTITWDTNSTGGGIAWYVSSGVIKNNVFDACDAVIGAAVYLQSCDVTVRDNLFLNCVTTGGGGTVSISGGSPTVEGNTFVGSSAPFGFQGTVLYATGSTYVFQRNIVEGSLGGPAVYCGGTNITDVNCNLFWNNQFGTFGGTCADSTGFSNNVIDDPLFCNAGSEDFGLCADSPALLGPCGPIGYVSPTGNCAACSVPTNASSVESATWSFVKALYRD